jgi:peptidyl-prolyl cis-trans isomerase SurA
MRSPRFFRSAALLGSAALIALASVGVDAQQKKSGAKAAKPDAKKSAENAQPKIDHKAAPPVLKTSFGQVPLHEFEAAFRRMNGKDPYATTLDSLLEFLDVYADYRLKLQDAKESGLFNDAKIKAEIASYREMLAGPYLLEKELTDPSVKDIYEKRKWEVNASHFLAKLSNPNDPNDTTTAWNKIQRAMSMLKDGQPMGLVVMNSTNNALLAQQDLSVLDRNKQIDPSKYTDGERWDGSDDKGSIKSAGNLGYFTGGMTVRQFENEAYRLKPGEMSEYPVKTRYGYHVIQVHDRVPRIGGVKLSHILVQCPKFQEDTTLAWAKIDSIYKLIKSGADFAQLAKENSEDKFTAPKGGDMDFINREERRAEAAFDKAAYGLKDGELSEIVRTSFGYHIIKRTGTIPLPSFEEEKEKLKQMYKKYYFEEDRDKFIENLKTKYGFKVDLAAINRFLTKVDTTRTSLDSAWTRNITKDDREQVIYVLNNQRWTIGSLVDSLNADPGSPLARLPINDMVKKVSSEHALRIASAGIEKKYPDFETMMQDYQNGIVLFELENQRVWSRAVPDTAGVRKFFNENRMKFLWPERVDVSEIFILNDSLAKAVYKRAMAGENFDDLARQYTERPGYKDKAGRWPLLQKDENEIAKKAFTFVAEEIKEPFRNQAGYSIVRLNRRVPAAQKTFDEARQEAGSQYQEAKSQELRKNWVDSLRKKYNRQILQDLVVSQWKSKNPDRASN